MTPAHMFQFSQNCTVLFGGGLDVAQVQSALTNGATIISSQMALPSIQVQQGQPQMLMCQTSGSSGAPKTIRRKPISWIQSFDLNARQFEMSEQDTYAILGHLGHSLPLFACLEAMHLGADVALLSGTSPKTQCVKMANFGATVLYATPTQLRLLCNAHRVPGTPVLPSLRHIFCGGGKLNLPLRTELATLCPNAELHEFFGAAETSFITISDAKTPEGSVGRAYPGVTIDVRGIQNGVGEIWVSSPYLFDGYAQGDSKDTCWDGRFLSIGEMGRLDDRGYLFLTGRRNRMVTVADQNIFPEQIERVIGLHPDVAACAVLTPKNALRGHQIVCVVELSQAGDNNGFLATTEPELRGICRHKLGAASVPRRFICVDQLPMLPAGKPDLAALEPMVELT